MSPNSYRAIAPKATVSAHAQMLNGRNINRSPISTTPIKNESVSPPASHLDTTPSLPSAAPGSLTEDGYGDFSTPSAPEPAQEKASEAASSPSRSPRLKLRLKPRSAETASPQKKSATALEPCTRSSPSSSSSSGLKLKLRGIQAAIRESLQSTDNSFSQTDTAPTHKRTSNEAALNDDFDTDSEFDFMPPSRKVVKPTAEQDIKPKVEKDIKPTIEEDIKPTVEKAPRRTAARKAKKVKTVHTDSDYDDDAMFDAGDEQSSPNSSPDSKLVLSSNVLKRSERMLDPKNPDHAELIAAATKAGPEYYDSDADELPGNVKETNKPHLFLNVKWGALATDYSHPEHFTTEPEFTQFVPGRFERLPDGTASDQKHKLVVKLTDKQHRQRIFLNPPPRDWANQDAITALNKRTVQQIRRNTHVRFREVVEPYVKAEREWILAHLTGGKPSGGWKKFVDAFNRKFEGEVLEGCKVPRPERSHSSLTKEVERFGEMYARGVVPKTVSQARAVRKGGK